jgi:molybdenum cofactor cytidylyltransferase
VITGILLAAGQGRRFGGAKLLHVLPDARPLGLAALQALQAAVDPVIAVVAPAQPTLSELFTHAGARVVVCRDAHTGLGASIACGVRAAPQGPWLIALADMPCISPHAITQVAAAIAAGAPLAAPVYQGRRGHPVGFSQPFFADLCALSGDQGARRLLQAHADALQPVPTDDAGVLFDIDTPADLATLPDSLRA